MARDPNQFELTFVKHTYEGQLIEQRHRDGYINATAMCQAAQKNWADYVRLGSTKSFLDELSADMGIPISELIQSIKGGIPSRQGTWVHPQVATHLAQWLSGRFAVVVSRWVYEWMSGLGSPATTRRHTPIFVQRFHANWDRVEPGYFSIISELFVRVYGRLEQLGHVLADKAADGKEIRPDISVGKTFPPWLLERSPGLVNKFKPYRHLLSNHMEVDARQYHNSVLPAYIEFIETEWLVNHAERYFRERDPKALEYLPRLLPKPRKGEDDNG